MKCVLLSLFLTGAIVSAPTALDFTPAPSVLGEVSATLQSTAAFQAEQDEVHAVVVDMPEVRSLEYASPETWGSLPMPVQPYNQPSATPVFQLATNEVKSSVSN
jgi:hypothetical protein